MNDITLYGTAGCHLCELAEALVAPLLARRAERLHYVDIADSDPLLERYGVRSPVLRRGAAELGWPFDAEQVAAFLDG
jgi:hypothetical protein